MPSVAAAAGSPHFLLSHFPHFDTVTARGSRHRETQNAQRFPASALNPIPALPHQQPPATKRANATSTRHPKPKKRQKSRIH
ncbi:hypothetical protein B0H67DRAFT_591119 [Lasiosphaeris hirsuta]|uniref:Uncharacterized protein n=1 Tax=Lasiosphaeris hirsuta TaxID=260670 RepID=A0AA39ZV73_9PEZI|nr:hypothetical protein B0H67DRAFT_591119 [Lasiosphaeris hirsuta]